METNLASLPSDSPPADRSILFLCDTWNELAEGLQGVNRSLALSLTGFRGVQVYSTLLKPPSDLPKSSQQDACNNNIVLIGPSRPIRNIYEKVNTHPEHVYPSMKKIIPHVTHIVGHAPITARAAITLKKTLYPDSKVVLMYHAIPQDLLPFKGELPFKVTDDAEMIELAEAADVVYSLAEKIHWHYNARFRNRASKEIDNRLFIPQSTSEVFNVSYESDRADGSKVRLLTVVSSGCEHATWQGLDIALCASNKVAIANMEGGSTRPAITLVIGITGESSSSMDDLIRRYATSKHLTVECHVYKCWDELRADLTHCHLLIAPTRCEHHGHVGLMALSTGIPAIVSNNSIIAQVIKRLAVDPEGILVPVTASTESVRQDSSTWRDVISGALQELDKRTIFAQQLKIALKRDELTNETHDNFVHFILGGIKMKHWVSHLVFEYPTRVRNKETVIERSVNELLLSAMKQSWRWRRHPLIERSDLYQPIPDQLLGDNFEPLSILGVELPVEELAKHVTDKIEEQHRRIVAFDRKSESFIVYCPTIYALNDLWAACDEINSSLIERLITGEENPILKEYQLQAVDIRSNISGPELLKYKSEIAKISKYRMLKECS